jgi:hypothetical protein
MGAFAKSLDFIPRTPEQSRDAHCGNPTVRLNESLRDAS